MEQERRRKRNKREIYIKIFAVICFISLLCFCLAKFIKFFSIVNPALEQDMDADENHGKILHSNEWNLILVNKWNKIPDNYNVTLTVLSNGRRVDERIYTELQEMFDAARAEGIYPVVGEGFRTAQEQQALFTDKVREYMNEGYLKKAAEKMAGKWVALPGYSEHQLGIAVDINGDKIRSDNGEVYEWLAKNAYRYGFILRYPSDSENITSTKYEPWHYRYVGKKAAKEIYSENICLEEYLERLQ